MIIIKEIDIEKIRKYLIEETKIYINIK